MPSTLNITFQESNSTYIQHINILHDHIILIVILLFATVTFWITIILSKNNSWSEYLEENDVELFWTALPSLFLTFLLVPSVVILYIIEDLTNPSFTVNATGNQWYWNYTYPELNNLSYDSFLNQNANLRLLEVNNNILAPSNIWVRIISTSNDVIHAWAIPSLGLNIDSIPGRLNTTTFNCNRSGYLTGQCSEICGMNHSFIPIILHIINPNSLPFYTNKP